MKNKYPARLLYLLTATSYCLFSTWTTGVLPSSALALEDSSSQNQNSVDYLIAQPTLTSPISQTIGDVRNTLQELLQTLKSIEQSATTDAKSIIDQIDGRIQNLIKEIDNRYANNLDRTVGSLRDFEKDFFRDVDETIFQTKESILQGLDKGTESAIKLLREADISSYDALYALPCRDKIPRIVYPDPSSIEIGINQPIVKIRGNFLNIGRDQKVQINGEDAVLKGISSNEITVQIPDSVINSISNPETISISVITNKSTVNRILFLCNQRIEPNDSTLSVAIALLPQLTYKISGFIGAHWEELIPETENSEEKFFSEDIRLVREENCDANVVRPQQHQIPEPWMVKRVNVNIISVNGSSSIERVVWSGNTVTVDVHVIGLGTTRIPNPLLPYVLPDITDCRGRGWVEYQLEIVGEQITTIPSQVIIHDLPRDNFSIDGMPGQNTFAGIRHPQASEWASLRKLTWFYEVTIRPYRGTQDLPIVQLSSTNPRSDGYFTDLSNGELTIDIRSTE